MNPHRRYADTHPELAKCAESQWWQHQRLNCAWCSMTRWAEGYIRVRSLEDAESHPAFEILLKQWYSCHSRSETGFYPRSSRVYGRQ
jgi:hypothetical protein